jgi:polyisoprenoid-binding protein YceI
MSATVTAIPAGTYQDDGTHSTAALAVKHMLATFRAGFPRLTASLTVGDDGAARLVGSVPVSEIVVKDESLAAHLQSPEFFDAEQHPEITFESTGFEVDGSSVTVAGRLTIRGHTEPVVATGTVVGPTDDPWGNTKLGVQLETVVDRTKFGMNWNAPLPKGGFMLADDVTLTVDLELKKA